jgi:dienelactone hydrolase
MRGWLLALAAGALLAPSGAQAGSLPSVSSGKLPGPPLLYEKAPRVPQLEVRAPFRARPLLVSGTDAYRRGEYVHQDYLFDDHGGETGAASSPPGTAGFSPPSGDLLYPAAARYANNAADLVELRIRPTRTAIVYRVTLGAVLDDDATVVGIGVDADRAGDAEVAWPHGAGLTSPGLDRFITAWGTGGDVTELPGGGATPLPAGAVRIDRRTNQMTIRVPRELMDPKRATWRYVAGAGLWSGSGFERPSPGLPGVFNLAFRFHEPQPRGSGTWFEAGQAAALGAGTSGAFRADVDFARLASRANRWIHPPARKQARIYPSRLHLHEGVRSEFPEFGGRLQPYLVFVPKTYRRTRRAGVTFALHSLSATYTQYAVFSPNQQRQLGDDEGRFYVTPLSRGPDGWYTDEAEVDFFEVWADLARRFRLDATRVALSGYSMGGYGTYKLGMQWPDLFGAAFTTVGPPLAPGYLNTGLLVENARWLPYLNWAGHTDALVPIAAVRAQQRRFDELGLRSQLWTYPGGHYDRAGEDEWEGARAFLAASVVQRDPNRVDYAFVPSADRERLGLVHDHAYWISHLRARAPARAEISARSFAFGRAFEPVTKRVTSADGHLPKPESVSGTAWERIPAAPKRNALALQLDNLRRAHVDGRRARLSGERCLRVSVATDGRALVRLSLPFPAGAVARRGRSCAGRGAPAPRQVFLTRGGATILAPPGSHRWVILGE